MKEKRNTLLKLLQKRAQPLSVGRSMLPLLHENDRLNFKKTTFNKIAVNDFVLFYKNKEFITHRVIYKTKKYLITKGDNNLVSDRKIYPAQVIAKVKKVTRGNSVFSLEDIYLIQSAHYFSEIKKILRELSKQHIETVILKGLPLHLLYENTHPKRLYCDCDILIHPSSLKKTHSVLTKHGYKKEKTTLKGIKATSPKEINYYKIIKGFPVVFDVHLEPAFFMTKLPTFAALFPQAAIHSLQKELMEYKRSVLIEKTRFPLLSPPYLILYLALHFFHHNYRGIHRLSFLYIVIKNHFSELKKVSKLIHRFQLKNFAYGSFFLLSKYFGTEKEKYIFNLLLKDIEPSKNELMRIKKRLTDTSVFDDQTRTNAGIERFKLIFALSPFPLWKKLFVFTHPAVFVLSIRTLVRKLVLKFKIRG